MKEIIALTDYKNHFGSKWDALPYNSGFDKKLLSQYFRERNYQIKFVEFSKVTELRNIKNIPILYTSSEDIGYHYKSYIEDVVLFLQESGGKIIPEFKFLRANNNKIYMELISKQIGGKIMNRLDSWIFGTFEEMQSRMHEFTYPIVIKSSTGAMGRGVSLAKNEKDLIKKVKSIIRTQYLLQDIKDNIRPYKYKGYKVNSLYREKFVLQSFIPDLKNDWKILIFGDKYFIFSRPVRKNDFRASGSGNLNYSYGSECNYPQGIFEFAKNIFEILDVPHLSIDIAYDGNKFYLIEFQAIFFGTVGHVKSDVYFKKEKNNWIPLKNTEPIEKIYAASVIDYLEKND